MKKTLFVDIDGCLIKHRGNLSEQMFGDVEVLPGVLEKLNEWNIKEYKIILATGRPESTRELTERQLQCAGIFYDQLIMGLGRGERIIINDRKPTGSEAVASGIEVMRNEGLGDVKV